MPTLDFKGKQFVYSHHLSVPFRELRAEPGKSLPAAGKQASLDDNLIIHGDNLEALKALLPTHAGKIDCIFIDPPYNTGNEGWCYNDNVRSPLMKEWLKKSANPVDKEDLERHEKWLCMMWPRLQLLHELLAEDGVIFVSIDDHESHNLEATMCEIFGEQNNLGRIVARLNPKGRHLDNFFAKTHEYVLVFCKNHSKAKISGIEKDSDMLAEYDEEDKIGKFRAIELRNRNSAFNPETRENLYYPIYVDPVSGTVSLEKTVQFCKEALPHDSNDLPTCWTWGKKKFVDENHLLFSRTTREGKWRVFRKDYLPRDEDGGATTKPKTIWLDPDLNMDASRKALRDILGNNSFDFPKPVTLVERLIGIATRKQSIILDSFAGSGTTAHAVLKANQKDGGNRRFILVECEDYADTLTAERVRRVIKGYDFKGTQREELLSQNLTWTDFAKNQHKILEQVQSIENLQGVDYDKIKKEIKDGVLTVTGERAITETMPGLGGSFTYCTLGEPINIDSLLTGEGMPGFEALARYVFYTATGQSLTEVGSPSADGLIGETSLFRIHLFYQPNREWLRSNDSALNANRVQAIVKSNISGKRCIVFAVAKFMSQKELTDKRIEFCQLPYAVHRMLGD